ncbi:MAG: hypothetical protein A2002_08505 [Pseudomonadales bacterium GWC1_66_9]|nr:MAG: hypothetical protein A2002_08505 [Pseudomonadales bacterium GWC1_66_9]
MWSKGSTWAAIAVGLFIFTAFLMWMLPVYGVWRRKKQGEAELAEANFSEQVAIAEATARLKSATLNREAEEIDALAVANSVKVIGDSLKNNDGYLRWQWIKAMSETESDIIYVPTEANLPILEASRKGFAKE